MPVRSDDPGVENAVNFLHVTVVTATPGDILEHISQENLAVYRDIPARLQEDVSQESQVAHDHRGRLVYELLQNADDALLGFATTGDQRCSGSPTTLCGLRTRAGR